MNGTGDDGPGTGPAELASGGQRVLVVARGSSTAPLVATARRHRLPGRSSRSPC